MTVVFKTIFLAGLFLSELIRFPHRKRVSKSRRAGEMVDSKVRGSEALLLTASFFGLYLFPLLYIFSGWLSFADYHLPDGWGYLGILLMATALVVIWRAHADLGKNWSPSLEVVKEQKLVTQGVYRYLRHPIYTAMWLMTVAQALLLHNWLAGLGGLVTYLPIYLIRIPREEQMMLAHFGEEYRVYMRNTGRFFPRFGKPAAK